MPSPFDRRSFLVAGGGLLAAGALPRALAQGKAKPKMRFSGAFTEQDLEDLLQAGNRAGLKALLLDALADVAGFAATHGNRESVRRLNRDGRFRAIIRREV